MNKIEEFLKLLDHKLDTWNEHSQFKIYGIGNLSRSDIDELRLYAETYQRYGCFYDLMKPMGSIKEVLSKAGIEDKSYSIF